MGKRTRLLALIFLFPVIGLAPLQAQYSMGTTGLLNIPTADMQPDGTFMGGANFLPRALLPERWETNSGNYFMNITFLSFVEIAYRCTLMKGEFKGGNKWQQDRSVSLRLRPLKEDRWWPSIVLGSNDAFTSHQLNALQGGTNNRFFSSVFLVGTKHLLLNGHDIGFTVGGDIPFRDDYKSKLFGGVAYSPFFCRALKLMVEYDGEAVNAGVAACFFRHLSVHVFGYDGKAIAAGLRYEVCLIHK